jgi:hypothetical protein
MNDTERKVLAFLAENGSEYFCYMGFAAIVADTKLDRKQVRRACRSLARKGLAKFSSGLWTEDGEPAGSGYGVTKDGVQMSQSLVPR